MSRLLANLVTFGKRVVGQMPSSQRDIEGGMGMPTNKPPIPSSEGIDGSLAATPPPQHYLSQSEKLSRFRFMLGIHNAPDLVSTNTSIRPAPNVGLYARAVEFEARAAAQYRLFAILINGALGFQIIIAAALTALGAGHGPHSAVTCFGAMNTVLAGFLTFLKGSGLPNRMKYYQNEWLKVREYIEQRERDFARQDCELNVEHEIMLIERMYEDVRRDVEANTPDSYVSMSAAKKTFGVQPGPTLASGSPTHLVHTAGDKVRSAEEKMMAMAEAAAQKLLHTRSQFEQDLDEKRNQFQHGLDDQRNQFQHGLEDKRNQFQHDLDGRRSQLQHGVDDKRNQFQHGVDDKRTQLRHGMDDQRNQFQFQQGVDEGRSQLQQGLKDQRDQFQQGLDDRRSQYQHGVDEGRSQLQHGLDDRRDQFQHGLDDRRSQFQQGVDDRRNELQQGVDDRRYQLQQGLDEKQKQAQHFVDDRLRQVQHGFDEEKAAMKQTVRDMAS